MSLSSASRLLRLRCLCLDLRAEISSETPPGRKNYLAVSVSVNHHMNWININRRVWWLAQPCRVEISLSWPSTIPPLGRSELRFSSGSITFTCPPMASFSMQRNQELLLLLPSSEKLHLLHAETRTGKGTRVSAQSLWRNMKQLITSKEWQEQREYIPNTFCNDWPYAR